MRLIISILDKLIVDFGRWRMVPFKEGISVFASTLPDHVIPLLAGGAFILFW